VMLVVVVAEPLVAEPLVDEPLVELVVLVAVDDFTQWSIEH